MKENINFLKFKFVAIGLSIGLTVLFTAGTIVNGGFNFGIDFVGGVKIIAAFEKNVDEGNIRETLKDFNPLIQQIGDDEENQYIISTKLKENKNESKNDLKEIRGSLEKKYKKVEFLNVENVGPAIGDFLKKSAFKLFFVALVLMMVYLSFRFEFKYSMGAVAAILHDILICVLFCGFMRVEINIPVVAALLTIFGYSINDTIVIFDRIRENVEMKTKQSVNEIINKSVTQSITRTLLTSLTTLFAVLALYLLGGAVLNEFALVLLFGIFIGTYSSVYIASPMLIAWEKIVKK